MAGTEYIWMVGPSGVGKRAFIQRLGRDPGLRAKFDIPVGFEGRGPGVRLDDSTHVRASDLALSCAPAVVIKWQDSGQSEIAALLNLRPGSRHRIIVLRRDPLTNHRDLEAREGGPRESPEGIAEYGENCRRWARGYASMGVRVQFVDADEWAYEVVWDSASGAR